MSHFTLQDRITIQSELSHRLPFHSIALLLSKVPPRSPAKSETICLSVIVPLILKSA